MYVKILLYKKQDNKEVISMEELKGDKVFISYSWTSPEHERWVLELANRLVKDNIEVVFDKWDTVEGQNLNAFMEKSVNDPTIKKVLVICDELYVKKANGFEGGVGTETVIISKEVYNDVQQTKFIPVISERDSNGKAVMPTYFGLSKYIDLSTAENYEEEYEKLLRNLYGKPEYKRPKQGKTPSFLLEDDKDGLLSSTSALRTFQHRSEKKPGNIDIYFSDFRDDFINDYQSFAIEQVARESLPVKIYNNYNGMLALRNNYIQFLESYIRISEKDSSRNIIEFFEVIYQYATIRKDISSSYYEGQFEHMKLFIHELVLYTVAVLLKYKKYSMIKDIASNYYMLTERGSRDREGVIGVFFFHPELLQSVQPNSDRKYKSYSGHLLKERANYSGITFDSLVEADLLLDILDFRYFIKDTYYKWFLSTSPYIGYKMFDIMKKLKSSSYFEEVKVMYGVTNVDEMKSLISSYKAAFNPSYSSYIDTEYIIIDPDKIAIS